MYLEQKLLVNSKVKNHNGGKNPNTKNSSGYIINISCPKNKKFEPCIFCSSDNQPASHPVYKCDKFPDATSKVDQIMAMKGCVQFSSLNHTLNHILTVKLLFFPLFHAK